MLDLFNLLLELFLKGKHIEFQIKYNNVGKFFICLGTERIEIDKANNIYKKL